MDEELEQFESDVTSLESDPEDAFEEEVGMYPFVRHDAGERMLHWHRSGNDPVYAVGSFYLSDQDYPKRSVVTRALASLQEALEEPDDDWDDDDLLELETLTRFLQWQLEFVYTE